MTIPDFSTVFLLLFAWTLVAVVFGMLICAAIHHADVVEAADEDAGFDLWEQELCEGRHPSGRADDAIVADFERRRAGGWL